MSASAPWLSSLRDGEEVELQPCDGCDPSVYYGGAPVVQVVVPPEVVSSAPPPEMSSSSGASGRSATAEARRALKIHSEAERRRRERINAHLATLRRMIPGAKQMDKATLLARVVGRVKDLKRRASEAAAAQRTTPLPREADEVSIECYTGDNDDDDDGGGGGGERFLYMKASVSCDDRPGLVAGLAQALHGLRLRTVRAEMSSMGERVRHVFTLCCREEEEGTTSAGGCVGVMALKEAVRQALAKASSSSEMVYGSSSMFQSKRQRILESHYSIMSI